MEMALSLTQPNTWWILESFSQTSLLPLESWQQTKLLSRSNYLEIK
jgi:hypothetical protein